jgi:hypothetical protein
LSKLKDLKNSNKEDPSSTLLAKVLNFIFAGYVIFFIIGIIVSNLLPDPIPYYVLLTEIISLDMVVNQAVTAATILWIDEHPDDVTSYCGWTVKGAADKGKPLCPWINASIQTRAGLGDVNTYELVYSKITDDNKRTQHPIEAMLPIYAHEVQTATKRLEKKYATIRREGDVFDKLIQGPFEMFQFVNGTVSMPTNVTLTTLWNVMGTFSDAMGALANELEITTDNRRAWQFVMANRYRITEIFKLLADMIPGQATALIQNNIVYHFVMAALSIVFGVLLYIFVIIPRLRVIQIDREKILRLILLVPKENIYDLVYNVYTAGDEEEEEDNKKSEDEDDEGSDDEESKVDEEAGDTQDVVIIADRGIKLYAGYGLGFATLTIPVIFFAIFRFVRSGWCFMMVGLLNNLTVLYHDMETLSFQVFAGSYKCSDATFCYPDVKYGIKRFLYSVDEVGFFIYFFDRVQKH